MTDTHKPNDKTNKLDNEILVLSRFFTKGELADNSETLSNGHRIACVSLVVRATSIIHLRFCTLYRMIPEGMWRLPQLNEFPVITVTWYYVVLYLVYELPYLYMYQFMNHCVIVSQEIVKHGSHHNATKQIVLIVIQYI